MGDLSKVTLVFGALVLAVNGLALGAPGVLRRWISAFPRSRLPAWVLTAICLLWAGRLLYDAPLGRFDSLKPLLYVLTPLSIALVGLFVDDLLAPRALGGVLVLVAAPLLDAARWHGSALRLVVVLLAYALVVEGVVLVVCPYRFRKEAERFLPDDRACRRWGGAGCVLGAVLVALALLVY